MQGMIINLGAVSGAGCKWCRLEPSSHFSNRSKLIKIKIGCNSYYYILLIY